MIRYNLIYYDSSHPSWRGGGQYYVLLLERFLYIKEAASSKSVCMMLLVITYHQWYTRLSLFHLVTQVTRIYLILPPEPRYYTSSVLHATQSASGVEVFAKIVAESILTSCDANGNSFNMFRENLYNGSY